MKRPRPVLAIPEQGLTRTHEVTMRQAVRRVARGMFLVTVVLFDILTAFAALMLVLIWGGTI